MSYTRRQVLLGASSLTAVSIAARLGAATSEIRTWRQYVNCRWGQIHLNMAEPVSTTANHPPFVCLHQTPRSGEDYRELQRVMAVDRLVVAPDTPGYGNSSKPPQEPTMEEYGSTMLEAFNNLGYGEGGDQGPIDILAYHTGNFIALEMARQQPSLIRKLVMIGIPMLSTDTRALYLEQNSKPNPVLNDPNYVPGFFQKEVLDREMPGINKERNLDFLISRLRAGVRSRYASSAVYRYEYEPVIRSLKHPVLIPIIDEILKAESRKAATIIENAVAVERMDLDDQVWHVAPEELAAVIKPFLDS